MLESTLRSRVRGQVLQSGDQGYDEERTGWNLAIDHRPAVIVVAANPNDVVTAVKYAAAAGMPVAVMATGHGQSVPAVGAMLISTRLLSSLEIDPARATARIGAGVRWDKVVAEAAPHGLAPLVGTASDVGAVGYLTAGGLPVLGRQFGFAVDHVRSFDLVTADGRPRHVTAESEPDLFWAVRGGKGNFGVVTMVETDLMSLDRLVGGNLIFPGGATGPVLSGWLDWAARQPEEMTSSLALARFPDIPGVPEPMRGKFVVNVSVAYTGPAAKGELLIQPLRDLKPATDTVVEMPHGSIGSIHNPPPPAPIRNNGTLLRQLDAAAAERITALLGPEVELPPGMTEVRLLGGALSRRPEQPSAISYRDAPFSVIVAMVPRPGDEERVIEIQRSIIDGLRAWDTGTKLPSLLGGGETEPDQVRAAYSDADYQRLTAIKTAYDPDNLFRINHNIPPNAATSFRDRSEGVGAASAPGTQSGASS